VLKGMSIAAARPEDRTNPTFLQGVGRLVDPKVSLASVASMLLAAAFAAREGPLAWGWLALTVVGIFCIEIAKNASGELVDFRSSIKRWPPRTGVHFRVESGCSSRVS
jgi:hypothetical protein